MATHTFEILIVGAGPGGISIAADLFDAGISNVCTIEKGEIGQSWHEYPPETRLLSESHPDHDENAIAGLKLTELMPNIPHPTHEMYVKYLRDVVQRKNILVHEHVEVQTVSYDAEKKIFIVSTNTDTYESKFLIWATGMYETPDEQMHQEGCFVHYSRIQDWNHITDPEIMVIGGANGATEVVLQLAKPGRKIRLVTSKFEIPEPIDCLWKENRVLVRDFEKQGLVEVIEGFRVEKIFHDDTHFIIHSTDGKTLESKNRPIICIGFLPNIVEVKQFVDITHEGHGWLLDLDASHQSKKTPNVFFAGTIGKLSPEEGFIRHFRSYGSSIVEAIKKA